MSDARERYHGLVRVIYPLRDGRLVLRTEADWDRDVEPVAQDSQGFDFEVAFDRPYLHFKPCLRRGDEIRWAGGANRLALLGLDRPQACYPHFDGPENGRITEILEFDSPVLGRRHRLRVYLPAGYDENVLKCYPVLYMQDGANVFFPEEAFLGREWQIDENLDLLNLMNLIDRTIVVGVHAGNRKHEYTKPGYEAYGRALVTEVKPFVDGRFRTLLGYRYTGAMGSSLGGVVSFYLAWQWPEVFGNAGCLSSTFSHQDDLIDRVRREDVEPRRHLRIYLDSGWPQDNYETTLSMAGALIERGFVLGQNLFHLAFPNARHDEDAWAARCHLPLQLFSGRLRRAAEGTGGDP